MHNTHACVQTPHRPLKLGRLVLKNRVMRAAAYSGATYVRCRRYILAALILCGFVHFSTRVPARDKNLLGLLCSPFRRAPAWSRPRRCTQRWPRVALRSLPSHMRVCPDRVRASGCVCTQASEGAVTCDARCTVYGVWLIVCGYLCVVCIVCVMWSASFGAKRGVNPPGRHHTTPLSPPVRLDLSRPHPPRKSQGL